MVPGTKIIAAYLIVQLGLATEELNQANTGQIITDVKRQVRNPALRWMAATLDGRVEATEAVFAAKFMLPWSRFSSMPRCISAMTMMLVPISITGVPTASLPRGSKCRYCSCSFINASADRLPTAVSTTGPTPRHRPNSRLEAAYHRADKAIQKIVDVLAAA
jgi:hypothetical protein